MPSYEIHLGNNLDILPTLPDNSVDSIVTDPPYELGFMGKKWDSSGIAYNVELWRECLRVLKPGGHLLAFSGSRTYHRMVVAIEDAGFEIRDMISWISNKTFPKSHNVANAIDKSMGETNRGHAISSGNRFHPTTGKPRPNGEKLDKYESRTPESKGWEGWGTALKPTVEPIVMARKPLIGTVAENVLTYGTGGLNIEGSRIGTEKRINQPAGNKANSNGVYAFSNAEINAFKGAEANTVHGRWPANIILDETTEEMLGTSARFFYVARASKRDRNEGLEKSNSHPTVKPTTLMQYLIKLVTPLGGVVLDPFTGSGSTGKAAILDGFYFIGIELTEEYLPIINGRLAYAQQQVTEAQAKKDEELF